MAKDSGQISLLEAISIGIGGMVGGGIFAVLGLAVSLAKGGTPVAFLVAGILAMLTCYSYVKLSTAYPDNGGTVKFVNQGFGKTVFSGAVNNLLWLSYIIMLSLYASAFGSYAPNLFKIFPQGRMNFHIYASAIIIFATAINYYSIKIVGKVESYAVVIKLIILVAFVGLGAYALIGNPNISQLSIQNWENPIKLFAGGMVIFVAYEGFELIANAAPNIKNPKKNVPRAYYTAVGFVIILYILIAIITVGTLPFKEISTAKDYVLAEAAKPMLGQTGFVIITITALISTFSAINASLLGGSRVNYEIAEDEELPKNFLHQFWGKPIGLMITAVATLILTNILKIESISTAGSIAFILIFGVVNFVAFKLSKDIKGNKKVPLIGFIMCCIAVVALIIEQYSDNKIGIFTAGGIIVFCVIAEYFYRKYRAKNSK